MVELPPISFSIPVLTIGADQWDALMDSIPQPARVMLFVLLMVILFIGAIYVARTLYGL